MPRTRHLIFALALACAGDVAAVARDADGYLPRPISAVRLAEYADALDLSAAQRHALENLHAEYREAFRKLSEDEIAPWWASNNGAFLSLRSFYTKERDLAKQIAVIDNRLFDQMQTIMSDDQIALLPRVRQVRERDRLSHDFFAVWGMLPPFDLSEIVMHLALSPDQRQAIEPIMLAYEPALTSKLKAYVDADFTNIMQQYDALERVGFTDARIRDPANQEALTKALEEALKPVSDAGAAPRYRRTQEILQLNRQTLISLQAALPHEFGMWLRNAFLRTSYPSLHRVLHDDSPFDDALGNASLPPQLRTVLQDESDRFEREITVRLDRAVARIDAFHARYDPIGSNEDVTQYNADWRSTQQDLKAWFAEMDSLRQTAQHRVAEITGAAAQSQGVSEETSADLLGFDVREIVLGAMRQAAVLVPLAISQREMAEYALRLKLDATQQRLLREVQERHAKACESFEATARKAASDATQPLHYGDNTFNVENVERFDAAQTEAAKVLRALDEDFFADVRQTLGLPADDPGLQRIRLARQRQWWNPGLFGGLRANIRAVGGARESLLDLSTLLYHMRNIDVRQPGADRILAEYEQTVSPLMKTRYDLVLATQKADNDGQAEYAALAAQGRGNWQAAIELNERLGVEKMHTAAIAVNKQIAELNHRTFGQLVEMLPAAQGEDLRRTYERLCWPRIYRDPSEAGPLLTSALHLRDLTPQQRADIEEVAAQYRPAYQELCRAMTEAVEKPDSPIYGWNRATDQQQQDSAARSSARKRMLFDRYELNMRVWQRLRGILKEDQAKRAGLKRIPPEPPEENEDFGA